MKKRPIPLLVLLIWNKALMALCLLTNKPAAL
jgi:hypothetical protein